MLGGEADQRLIVAAASGELGEDVHRRREGQGQALAAVLLDLALAGGCGREVGDRGRHQQHVAGGELLLAGRPQLLGADDVHARDAGGRLERHVGAQQHHLGAPCAAPPRQRQAHATGGAVADEPDAVDRLARAAGGDEHPRAGERRPLAPWPSAPPPASSSSQTASRPAGSAMRPTPVLADGRQAAGGRLHDPRTARPQRVEVGRVAGCSYMREFIAGAITSGQLAASAQLVSRLSARPAASLAIVLADAGAIRYRSALATSSRWLRGSWSGRRWSGKAPRAGSRWNSVTSTGAPVSAANEAVPTKRRLVGVCTTRTAWPAPVARRMNSSAL